MDNEDYKKILELFQSGQYVLAQQLVRKHVNGFADWLADNIIEGVKDCSIKTAIMFYDKPDKPIYIHIVFNWWRIIVANYSWMNYHNFYNKIGRINALLKLKQYNKVKQKLKGVLKTLLLSAIHNKLN